MPGAALQYASRRARPVMYPNTVKHPSPSAIYDVIVIGGGHAGTEAALAAARMGCLLYTSDAADE